jgi:hypothetical protein
MHAHTHNEFTNACLPLSPSNANPPGVPPIPGHAARNGLPHSRVLPRPALLLRRRRGRRLVHRGAARQAEGVARPANWASAGACACLSSLCGTRLQDPQRRFLPPCKACVRRQAPLRFGLSPSRQNRFCAPRRSAPRIASGSARGTRSGRSTARRSAARTLTGSRLSSW